MSPSTSGIGFDSFTATSAYSFSYSGNDSNIATTYLSQSTYHLGAYAQGAYALSSVGHDQSGNSSWTSFRSHASFTSGTTSATLVGENEVIDSNATSFNQSTYNYVRSTATEFASFHSTTDSQSGNDSFTSLEYGDFNGGYNFNFIQYQASGHQTATAEESGVETFSTLSINSYTLSGNNNANTGSGAALNSHLTTGQETLARSGNSCWTYSPNAISSYTEFSLGSFDGAYSLSCVVLTEGQTATWSYDWSQTATETSNDYHNTASFSSETHLSVSGDDSTSTSRVSNSWETVSTDNSSTTGETLEQSGANNYSRT